MTRRRTLYVANLSPDVGSDELLRLFERYGAVCASEVIHTAPGDGTGAGFVEVDSNEHGEAAIAALDGTRNQGAVLIIGWADRERGRRRRRPERLIAVLPARPLVAAATVQGVAPPNPKPLGTVPTLEPQRVHDFIGGSTERTRTNQIPRHRD